MHFFLVLHQIPITLLFKVFATFFDIILFLKELMTKHFCVDAQQIIALHTLFWFPSFFYSIKQSNASIKSIILSIFSSVFLFFIGCIGLGCFNFKNWMTSMLFYSPVIIGQIGFSECSYSSAFSVLGFIIGCVPFPLDWPICWKEPPVSHAFLMLFGSILGSLIDVFNFN